jgi:hypothetical protein
VKNEFSAQLQFDFRTKRPSFIHHGILSTAERAGCRELNRQRTRAIEDAYFATASRRPIPGDVWATYFARRSEALDVPLISLSEMGFREDDEDNIVSTDLGYLDCGREAMVWADADHKSVYKLFDLKIDEQFQGSIGLKLVMQGRPPDEVEVVEQPGRITDMLEKICCLHSAGACPTEIAGLTEDGKYLVAKQPRCIAIGNFERDRNMALQAMNAVAPKGSFNRELWVFYAEDRFWLLSDLHEKNILRLQDGTPTIIDALTGPLPDYYINLHPKLADAAHRARALARGEDVPPDNPFENVSDDEL